MTYRIINLLSTTNAREWAQEFLRLFGDKPEAIDEGLMIAWFANAIETGRTAGEVFGEPRLRGVRVFGRVVHRLVRRVVVDPARGDLGVVEVTDVGDRAASVHEPADLGVTVGGSAVDVAPSELQAGDVDDLVVTGVDCEATGEALGSGELGDHHPIVADWSVASYEYFKCGICGFLTGCECSK